MLALCGSIKPVIGNGIWFWRRVEHNNCVIPGQLGIKSLLDTHPVYLWEPETILEVQKAAVQAAAAAAAAAAAGAGADLGQTLPAQ